MQILVVEDRAEVAAAMASLFRAYDHAVRIAENGAQALAILDGADVEVVFMDIALPLMDGVAVACAIRKRDMPQPRIYAVTALHLDRADEAVLEARFDGIFSKPVEAGALLDALGSTLT